MIEKVVEIPSSSLSTETLRAVVEEFVTREGTDYGIHEHSLDEKVFQVLEQLKKGEAVIQFDQRTESVNIILKKSSLAESVI